MRVSRVERARVVCHVLWLRVLERRLRASSGITVRAPIVCVVLHEVRVARVCAPRRITQCLQYPHCSERWFASACACGIPSVTLMVLPGVMRYLMPVRA